MWLLPSCFLLFTFAIFHFAYLHKEDKFIFSGFNGVPRILPLLSSTAANKAVCAMTCMGHVNCQSFSFKPGVQGCRLFAKRIMAFDVSGSSQDVHFFRSLALCPTWKGYVTVPGTSKCLLVGNVTMNWMQAQDKCALDGGHLLIVENADVMQRLQDFLPKDRYFVGFSDQTTEGRYLWMDGTAVDGSLFYATEPSQRFFPNFNEDCGMIIVGSLQPGLHDAVCSHQRKFLCSLPVEI